MGRLALVLATLGMLLHSCFGCAWHLRTPSTEPVAARSACLAPSTCGCHAHGHPHRILRTIPDSNVGAHGHHGVNDVTIGFVEHVTGSPHVCHCAYWDMAKRTLTDGIPRFEFLQPLEICQWRSVMRNCEPTLSYGWDEQGDRDTHCSRARLQIWRI